MAVDRRWRKWVEKHKKVKTCDAQIRATIMIKTGSHLQIYLSVLNSEQARQLGNDLVLATESLPFFAESIKSSDSVPG